MFNYLLLVSAILLVVIDSIYLTLIKSFFTKQIQSVQGDPVTVNMVGLVLCYIFLISGINYFIITPNRPVNDAFLLGLIIYGVYETTNYALFKNWSILTVIIDTLWGAILFALTTYLTYKFKNLLQI
jgi:uncharacterized membrane protein